MKIDLFELKLGVQCDCGDRTSGSVKMNDPIKIEPIYEPGAEIYAWFCPDCNRSFAMHFASIEYIGSGDEE